MSASSNLAVEPSVDSKIGATTSNADIEKSATHRVAQKNLIFALAEEKYGIPLSTVKEVIGLTSITPLPHMPPFFKGLINLRGQIISVIDLRLKLGLPSGELEPKKTSIIIMDVNELTIGTIVDDVEEVVGFEVEQVETDLDIASSVRREYVLGIAKAEDNKLVLLLDIRKVLSAEELELITRETKASLN